MCNWLKMISRSAFERCKSCEQERGRGGGMVSKARTLPSWHVVLTSSFRQASKTSIGVNQLSILSENVGLRTERDSLWYRTVVAPSVGASLFLSAAVFVTLRAVFLVLVLVATLYSCTAALVYRRARLVTSLGAHLGRVIDCFSALYEACRGNSHKHRDCVDRTHT